MSTNQHPRHEFKHGDRICYIPANSGRNQYGTIISTTTHAARVDFDDERGIHIVALAAIQPIGDQPEDQPENDLGSRK